MISFFKYLLNIVLTFFLSQFLSYTAFASHLSFSCNFEEAHTNGTINQGLVLFDHDNLRYEYFNDELFIIFINKKGTFIHNKKNNTSKPIKNKIVTIDHLMEIAKNYPNIPKKIETEHIEITIEKSVKNNFIKRISIDSNNAKLSLYFNNCDLTKPINDLFFREDKIFNFL